VHYRHIRIKELPDTPISPDQVAIANRGYRSLYTGLDLDGWKVAEEARSLWTPNDWILKYSGEGTLPNRSLFSDSSFADIGFIVDFRFPRKAAPFELRLRESTGSLVVDPADPALAKLLVPGGQWNRLEGSVKGRALTATLNGKPWKSEQTIESLKSDGPISIVPSGALDLANIYIRDL